MKISPADYRTLLEAIRPLAPKFAAYRRALIAEGKARDVEMRLRWDALHAARINGAPSCLFLSGVLYPQGLNDSHVDTALRRIVAELETPAPVTA